MLKRLTCASPAENSEPTSTAPVLTMALGIYSRLNRMRVKTPSPEMEGYSSIISPWREKFTMKMSTKTTVAPMAR